VPLQLVAGDPIGASLGGAQAVCVFITLPRSQCKHHERHAGRSTARIRAPKARRSQTVTRGPARSITRTASPAPLWTETPATTTRVDGVSRAEGDPSSARDAALEEPLGVVHQDAVHEAEVDVDRLRHDPAEVRRSTSRGHLVADDPPAGPNAFDRLGHSATHQGTQLLADPAHRLGVRREERLGRDALAQGRRPHVPVPVPDAGTCDMASLLE